jgi:hypothetical protein
MNNLKEMIEKSSLSGKCSKELIETLERYERDFARFFLTSDIYPTKINTDGTMSRNLSIDFDGDRERNHLILMLAKNRNAWKHIDKVYQDNKFEYYKAYTETFFATALIKDAYSLEAKEYINKMAGIDAWCRINNTEEPIFKIIQKMYNKVYSKFKSGIKSIDMDRCLADSLKAGDKNRSYYGVHCINETEENMRLVVLVKYLAKVFDVEIEGFLWTMLSRRTIDELISEENLNIIYQRTFDITLKDVKKCKSFSDFSRLITEAQMEKASKTASIMGNTMADLNSLAENHGILERISEMLANNIEDLSIDGFGKALDSITKDLAKNVPPTKLYEEVMRATWLVKVNGLDEEMMNSLPINRHILTSAIIVCQESCEPFVNENIKEKFKPTESQRLKAIYSVLILSLLEKYKSQTPLTFSKENEEVVFEINKLNTQINNKDEEIKMLKLKIAEMENSNKLRLNDVLNELDTEISKNDKLKKELKIAKSNEKEFNALKELVYRNSISENEIAISIEEDVLTIEDKANYLDSKKIMVLGGHPNWVNKLKRRLPNARYIDVEGYASQKFTRLDKYDLLVVCTNYIDHGLIYKLGEAIKDIKSKKVVMVNNVNTDTVLDEIYSATVEYENNHND